MKKIVFAAGAALALLGVSVWIGVPLYKRHEQRQLVAQATSLIAQKEFAKAMATARQVLETDPNDAGAVLAVAEAAELQDSPDALIWRQRVVELTPTLSNRVTLVTAALRMEDSPYSQAARALDEFGPEGKQTTDYHRLAGELALKLKNWDDAELHYREALNREPKNEQFQLKLGLIHLASPQPMIVSDARKTLELVTRHPRYGAEALRALAAQSVAEGDYDSAESDSRRLLQDLNSLYADRLQHLTILQALKSSELDGFLRKMQTAAVKTAGEVYQLGSWMSASGMADQALQWIQSLPFALQVQQPIPKAIAACHAARNDWPKLDTFLRDQSWNDDDYIRIALISHALFNEGEKKLAHFNWQKAVQLAAGRMDWMAELSKMAQSWGWQIEAEELLWDIVSRFPNDRSALRSLYRYYLASDNTLGLYKVHTALVRLDSSDASLKSKVASLSFLLNTEISKAQELARDVFTKDPRNYGFVSTYAYSLHLQGKTTEALKLMSALPSSELEVPEVAAYYGILLAAAGESEKAKKYLSMAERAQILPEDKKLLIQARKAL